jgi:autotransporter-associated beta strand protein
MKYLKFPFLFSALLQASISVVYAAPEFHGISAGDMTANSAVLWTQVSNGSGATPLTLQVSTDSNFATGVSTFATGTVIENGSTSKILVNSLTSNTQYFYRYTSGVVTSDTGTFFTTPNAGQSTPFKIGFTGDYDAKYRPYSALANFGTSLNPGSTGLKAFINLGDLMYERGAVGSPAVPSLTPTSSAATVDAARADYYRKYLEGITGVAVDGSMSSSGNQGMRSMLASTGVYSLLDNHELNGAMISGGAAQTSQKENLDLSQAVNTTGSYINQTDAFRLMTKSFYDTHATGVQINGSATAGYSFTNLLESNQSVNAPTDSRTNGTAQNFFTRSWGQAATYIQLDDRSYRDARMGDDNTSLSSQVANDPNRTMLGTTQYDWLKTQLLAAKNSSTWTVISVSTPIDQWDPNDNKSWLAGYNYERNNLMKYIADNKIEHVVFLTTDDHMNRVTQLKYQPDPINRPDEWVPVPGAFQVLSAPAGAVGPYFNAMDFGGFGISTSQTVLNNQSAKQPSQDAMGVGLMGMSGLANVYRMGDANATSNPTAIDFFTATQYGYSTLEWDRFANLRVKYWGIDAYASDSYPSATPTPYLVMSFGVHVPYTVASGASVALTDADFIDTEVPIAINPQFNSRWTVNGGLDISGMGGGGVAFNGISGNSTGTISLGAKTLTVTNADDTFAGVISGTGGLSVSGGRQVLSGVNTYTGATAISSGATLALSGLGSISDSSGILNNGLFEVSASTSPVFVKAITGSGAVMVNGGTLVFEEVNGYTGATTIQAGSTLALQGGGEINAASPITNSGVFNITGKSVDVTVGSYTQTPSGTLAMNFSPSVNQKMIISGPASIAGGLNLSLSTGAYTPGRYTFLSSTGGLTGSFSSLARNISPYTPYAYNLGYTSSEAYLTLYDFYLADTQQSLVNTSAALQNSFILQNSVLVNSFSYDCTEFSPKGICISAGGRNTAVQTTNGLNNTSALLIAAYKVHPQVRIGAYADQNLSVNNAGNTVNLSNNTPLIGLFGAWNERLDGTGTELKLSVAYGQNNSTITRQAVGTSEVGIGSSSIISQGAQATIKYGFRVSPNVIVSPYVGMRYTQNNIGGYTEGASSTVKVPLTYSALNTNATTALAGVGASYRFIPQATLFASAGVEIDTNTSNGSYVASGVMHLDPVNFNPNPVKTRPTATVGVFYDIVKNQRIGITGIYRQEPYQAVSTTSVMATYTIGL